MKVVVAGLPNTGAEVVEGALSLLGLKIYGRNENTLLLAKQWGKILNDQSSIDDVREMFKDVDAVSDIPACYFWEEILMAYPDVKIVFTAHEDENEWADGIADGLMKNHKDCDKNFLSMTSPTMRSVNNRVVTPTERLVYGFSPPSLCSELYVNKSLLKKRYRAHCAHVMENAPKDQLLVYKISDGWKPLCEFLGLNEPRGPFPTVESSKAMAKVRLETNSVQRKAKREQAVVVTLFTIATSVGIYKLVTDPPIKAFESALEWAQKMFSSVFSRKS